MWLDGEPVQGLVSGAGLRPRRAAHARARPTASARRAGGDRLQRAVRLGGAEPAGAAAGSRSRRRSALERCELARFDPDAWELASDLGVLAALMDEDGGRVARRAAARAQPLLQHRATARSSRSLLAPRTTARGTHEITAVGHAHIDTAWLWPLEETYRKCVRTFATPAAADGALPGLPLRVLAGAAVRVDPRPRARGCGRASATRVERGQWLPVGGTWIEPDCNLPAGESLVRQFLYGQRFFEREFGRRAEVFWNPDVFGYNGQLPQLMRGAGHQRLPDPEAVLEPLHRARAPHVPLGRASTARRCSRTSRPPTPTTPRRPCPSCAARRATSRTTSARRAACSCSAGATAAAGRRRRCSRRSRGSADLQGVPRTTIGDPEAFFRALAEEAETGRRSSASSTSSTTAAPTRPRRAPSARAAAPSGRCTTPSCSRAPWPARAGPRRSSGAWQTLLLNHFHDIIPGSSIGEVHARAERDLAEVARRRRARCATRLAARAAAVVNTIGVARREVVADGRRARLRRGARRAASGGFVEPRDAVARRGDGDGFMLANGHPARRPRPRRDAALARPRASGREAMAAPGNVLELYDDRPTDFEAWDLDPFHLETRSDCPPATRAEVALAEPLRAEVAVRAPDRRAQPHAPDRAARRRGRAARVPLRDRLARGPARAEGALPGRRARAARDLRDAVRRRRAPDALLHPRATLAQYEVPGHRFADLSEHGFGVALLSAATYGWSVLGGEMRMTLLRSPRWPDPDADVGEHELAFAICPHAGGWQEAGVTAEALRFNAPLLLGRGRRRRPARWFATDAPGAADRHRQAGRGRRRADRPALRGARRARDGAAARRRAVRRARAFTNLLEDPLGRARGRRRRRSLIPYRPFEIVTCAQPPAAPRSWLGA